MLCCVTMAIYPRVLATAGLAAVLLPGPALAQLRQKDALVSWFGAAGCTAATAPRSLVVAVQGFAQRVPNGVSFPSYIVNCGTAGDGSGSIRYCRDVAGTDCPITQVFASSSTCLPNDPVLFGSASVAVQCPAAGAGEVTVPGIEDLAASDVEVSATVLADGVLLALFLCTLAVQCTCLGRLGVHCSWAFGARD